MVAVPMISAAPALSRYRTADSLLAQRLVITAAHDRGFSFHMRRLSAVAVFVLLIAWISPASALLPLSMEHDSSVPVGANARSFTAADCNGDGVPDLVAAGQNSNDAIQHLNNGDGTFQFDQRLVVGTQPTGAACIDFDGDGLVDLAALSRDTGKLNVYRRTGPNSYEFMGFRTVGLQPIALTAGDLNGDGKIDLVAVNEHSDDMTALLTTGTGVPLASTIRLPTDSPRAAAIADLNLDGRPDIVIAAETLPSVVVLLGTGSGYSPLDTATAFSKPPTETGRGIAAGDFTGDGIPDIAFLSDTSNLTLYQGDGNGHFTFLDTFSIAPAAEAIHLADFNGDGLTDLAVLYSDGDSIEVFLASVPGRFAVRHDEAVSSSTPLNSKVVNSHRAMVSRAASASGAPPPADLQFLKIDAALHALQVVDQTAQGSFAITTVATFIDQPTALAVADLNNDGISDAIVGLKTSGRGARSRSAVQVLLGNASGGYDAFTGSGTCGNGVAEGTELCDDGNNKSRDGCNATCNPEINREVTSLTTADFDNDGAQDVLIVDARGQVLLLSGDGNGRFRSVRVVAGVKKGGTVAVGDFNGNGSPDIALVPKSRRQGAVSLLMNNGASFLPVAVASDLKLTGPLFAGDFDNNGLTDLVVGYKAGAAVLLNDGAGPVRKATTFAMPTGIQSIAAADFDEDGWLDLLGFFSTKKGSSLLFYSGSSFGQFGAPRMIAANDSFANATIADLNSDEHHDLVSCQGSNCAVLWGTGSGQFGSAPFTTLNSFIGPEVRGGGAADFDGDGRVDIVGTSKTNNTAVVIFGGDSTPPLGRLELPTGGVGPTSLAVADFNNDGHDDFIVVNEDSQDLSLFIRDPNNPRAFLRSVQRLPDPDGLGFVGLAVGDANGDGKIDVAVSQSGNATVTLLYNSGAVLVAGEPLHTGPDPRGVAFGHLNADNIPDIVTANRSSNTVSVLLSGPGGTYTRTDMGSGGLQPSAVALLDLNGDGFDDIVVLNEKMANESKLGNAVTLLNNGAGAFPGPPRTHIRGRLTPHSICVGNFDDDGNPDIAIGSFDSSDIMVLRGDGAGGWKPEETSYAVGNQVTDIDCHDADGDGLTDIAFGRQNGGDAGVVLTGK